MKKHLIILCITFLCSNTCGQTLSPAYIYTPNGSYVSDTYSLSGCSNPTYNEAQISTIELLLDSLYDGATLLGTPDYRYNCHAYAWHMEDHPNAAPVWMGWQTTTAEDIYWTDGSYVEVPEAIATKVSYHGSGNHSAVRENSTWYRSKWGNGILVRHHPDAVPNGIATPIINPYGVDYHPTLSKKYYAIRPASSLTGPSLINTYDIFSLNNLQSGYTVSWSLSDSYYNNGYNLLIPNYPSVGHCLIVRDPDQDLMNATLTAEIKYNGITVQALSKSGIYAYDDFWGQYTSGNLSGEINYTHYFTVKGNTATTVTSPNFVGATVTYGSNGATPTAWGFNPTNGVLNFKTASGSTVVIEVVNDACGNPYTLYAHAQNSYSMNVICDDGSLTISLNEDDEAARGEDLHQPWTLEIRNAMTGEMMTTRNSTSRSKTISTAGWPKGMYVVRVTIGYEMLTEKVLVN